MPMIKKLSFDEITLVNGGGNNGQNASDRNFGCSKSSNSSSNGGSGVGHNIGSAIGGAIGAAIGTEIGGPVCGVVGSGIGSRIGENIADRAHSAPSVSHTPAGIGTCNRW